MARFKFIISISPLHRRFRKLLCTLKNEVDIYLILCVVALNEKLKRRVWIPVKHSGFTCVQITFGKVWIYLIYELNTRAFLWNIYS